MKLELFPVSIFIGNIDLKKIKLTSEMGQAFLSGTPSSFYNKNILDPESYPYLMSIISELLQEKYDAFSIGLLDIWRNKYENNDYQEPHIHVGSKFSFIIYEKVGKPHTIFFNPAKYLIEATQGTHATKQYVSQFFKPQIRKGQIIVFPSYVEHMVNKNSDQATISGNIDFKFNQSPVLKKEKKNK
tara:strand:- start:15 stop:572 length:558 start_codon:yes stop_codon:yes gene_type:complete